jgi:hypothetical protein
MDCIALIRCRVGNLLIKEIKEVMDLAPLKLECHIIDDVSIFFEFPW